MVSGSAKLSFIAIPIEEYIKTARENVDLFVLDGTWREAKSIYYHCKFLHDVKKVSTMNKHSFVQSKKILCKSCSTVTYNTVSTNNCSKSAI